ncbi:MAG: hypothetical protein RBS99_18375 [Rhodospirillales bacterium]|jgi:hypothetical protein|nr:hypothetical protein [Rhodospirillales bacterium]
MITRSLRILTVAAVATVVSFPSQAATRLASIYFESFATLQAQVQQAAQVFQAPQLGTLPLLVGMRVPGAIQMNNEKPIAIHIMDMGRGPVALVYDVAPSGTAEAYLHALAGAGIALPTPTDGYYLLENGLAARIAGDRLLLAPQARRPEMWFGGNLGTMPPIPDMPGAVRVAIAPAAFESMLKQFRQRMAAAPAGSPPLAGVNTDAAQKVLDFYARLLSEMDGIYLGIEAQPEGLFIRSSLMTRPGSDLASLVGSMQPATPRQLAFIDRNSLFGYASGLVTLPPALKQQFIDLYVGMGALAPTATGLSGDEWSELMKDSLGTIGVPLAMQGTLQAGSRALLLQGLMGVPDPSAYLASQLALQKSPAFKKISPVVFSEPVTRSYKSVAILSVSNRFDEAAWERQLRASMPSNLPPDRAVASLQPARAMMQALMQIVGGPSEYAATPAGLAFGLGASSMIEQAVDRALAASSSAPEAGRIGELLAQAAPVHAMGRLSLSALLDRVAPLPPPEAAAPAPPPASPEASAILYADWNVASELRSVWLLPTSEIQAIRVRLPTMNRARQPRPQP